MSINVIGFRDAVFNKILEHNKDIDAHCLADEIWDLFDTVIQRMSDELDYNPENFVDDKTKDIEFGLYELTRLDGDKELMCLFHCEYTPKNIEVKIERGYKSTMQYAMRLIPTIYSNTQHTRLTNRECTIIDLVYDGDVYKASKDIANNLRPLYR